MAGLAMRSRVLILTTALIVSPVALWLILDSPHDDTPVRSAAIVLGVGWSFVVAAVVALTRSPGRFGGLMCAGRPRRAPRRAQRCERLAPVHGRAARR